MVLDSAQGIILLITFFLLTTFVFAQDPPPIEQTFPPLSTTPDSYNVVQSNSTYDASTPTNDDTCNTTTCLTRITNTQCCNKGECSSTTHKIVGVAGKEGFQCYIPLEPGAFKRVDSSAPLNVFLGQIFKYGIAVAITLAMVMLIYGGILKMTTDSWSKSDEAKNIIENALYGLGLVLISWLLLFTINPALVDFKNNTLLNPPPPPPTPPQAIVSKVSTSGHGISNDYAVEQLRASSINIWSSGSCSDQTNKKCTSLEGIPQSAIDGLKDARTHCVSSKGIESSCITVTAGTETGHVSHGSGIATVDISYNSIALKALMDSGLKENPTFAGGKGARLTFTCEPPGGGKTPVRCDGKSEDGKSEVEVGVIHVQFK